jgi:hypothetical protein
VIKHSPSPFTDYCLHTHPHGLIYHGALKLGTSENPVTEESELWEVPCGLQLSGPHMKQDCSGVEPV